MNSRELKFYSSSVDYILEVQNQDGSIPWEKGKKLDPWDHIEAAMGLSIAGNKVESEKAFIWLSDNFFYNTDFFFSKYFWRSISK